MLGTIYQQIHQTCLGCQKENQMPGDETWCREDYLYLSLCQALKCFLLQTDSQKQNFQSFTVFGGRRLSEPCKINSTYFPFVDGKL